MAIDAHETLERLVGLNTAPGGGDHEAAARLLSVALAHAGFEVRWHGTPPLIVATRSARGGGRGAVVVYNHYDVETTGPGWSTPPLHLVERGERLHGVGVGDNKGALAARVEAVARAAHAPAITWIIQGEEESGSETLRRTLPELDLAEVDLWVDENGWDGPDGVQRALLTGAAGWVASVLAGVGGPVTVERRVLNKRLVPGGCAFQAALPDDAPYAAFGLNDRHTAIHCADESIDCTLLARHVSQMVALLESFRGGEGR